MKYMFFFALWALLLFPSSVQSQQTSHIEISANDDSRYYYGSCIIPEGYAAKVDIYVWAYIPIYAIEGIAFALDYPDFVIPEDTFYVNYDFQVFVVLGDLENGIEIATIDCPTGWNWWVRQTIWVTATDFGYINITPHSDPYYNGEITYYFGYGDGQFDYISPFRLNIDSDYEPCWTPEELIVGTEYSSWGAIKSLYK